MTTGINDGSPHCFEQQKEFPTLPPAVTGGKFSEAHNTAKMLVAAHCPL